MFHSLSNHFNKENLDNNFRSRKKIIEFNNLFFKKIKTLLSDNLIGIYDDLEQKVEYASEGGFVRIELFDGKEYKNEILEKTKNEENSEKLPLCLCCGCETLLDSDFDL